MTAPDLRRGLAPARWLWFGLGWVAVAVGTVGIFLPLLPTTVFFVTAAACFARSSPRFEAWVLSLPTVGVLVSDYRAGLGMPRRAKRTAVSMIVVFGGISAWSLRDRPLLTAVVAVVVLIGVVWVLWRVPTRERVLARAGREPRS